MSAGVGVSAGVTGSAQAAGADGAGTPAYRRDIDGLRALAVLPVVLNHAEVPGFSGGFVGVDIFFVISGYLITGNLVRELAAGRFSAATFYRRRILRIFPALFAMLLATTAIACVAMLPGELVRYAHSLAAAALSVSNLLFYGESGYFDAASRAKPLLHTWSLGVEEQFYLVWPLLVTFLPGNRLRAALIAVTAASFSLCVAVLPSDAPAAFYLLPTRMWELGAGGVLALLPTLPRRRWINEAAGLIGLVLILFCVRRYYYQTPFPGAAAALPCLGAALLIWSGSGRTFAARILSIAPATFVGRISYSVYLWHWPVVVFANIWLLLPPSFALAAGEVIMSLVLGAASWRWIETPFRHRAGWPTRRVLLRGGAAALLATGMAGALMAADGLSWRYTPAQRAVAHYADDDGEAAFRRGTCFLIGPGDRFAPDRCLARSGTKPSVLLIGDSFAAHLWPGLSAHGDRMDVLQATVAGCAPQLYPASARLLCQRFYRDVLNGWTVRARPDAVLLAGRWEKADLALLPTTLAVLKEQGLKPVLVGPPPMYAAALPKLLVTAARRGDPGLLGRSLLKPYLVLDGELRQVAARAGVPYISLIDRLCRGVACRVWAAPGVPMQFDYAHFTSEGSQVAAELILPALDPVLNRHTR